MTPTLSGFLTFIRNVMRIGTTILPDDSPTITMAFNIAMDIVNDQLNAASPDAYTLAVYNLAGDNLLNYAQDQPGAPTVEGSDPPQPFFANARTKFNLTGFVPGVISSAGDEGTSTSYVVQEAAKTFTLADLQNLKTPYGRQYLAFAQRYGTIWGLT